jgi:hypothetical protein
MEKEGDIVDSAKALKRKGRWSTINLTSMIKATRAQLPK